MVDRVGMMGLLRIDLPAATVLLCDGGFLDWDGDVYRSSDPLYGAIGSLEALSEGIAESVPALDLTLLPTALAGAEDLVQPGFQRSRVRFWIAEFAPDDGMPVGDPEPMFDGQIDQATLVEGRGERRLELSIVSNLERLFTRNRGNSLNPRWHKSVWPGETGHDNATGLAIPVAWGVESRGGGGSSGFGPGGSNPAYIDRGLIGF